MSAAPLRLLECGSKPTRPRWISKLHAGLSVVRLEEELGLRRMGGDQIVPLLQTGRVCAMFRNRGGSASASPRRWSDGGRMKARTGGALLRRAAGASPCADRRRPGRI